MIAGPLLMLGGFGLAAFSLIRAWHGEFRARTAAERRATVAEITVMALQNRDDKIRAGLRHVAGLMDKVDQVNHEGETDE